MKLALFILAAVISTAAVFTPNCLQTKTKVTDWYDISLRLYIPRTYDNMTSQGYRKYQRQRLNGSLLITYDLADPDSRPVITVTNLVNMTHKINWKRITYSCNVDEDMMLTRVNLIGNNKTEQFKTGSINFYLDAEPSYSIGEDDEDNSLFLTLSGRGSSFLLREGGRYLKSFSGNAAGTLGCGCRAYGHISPTRVNGAYCATDRVDDVASVWGSWSAKWKRRD